MKMRLKFKSFAAVSAAAAMLAGTNLYGEAAEKAPSFSSPNVRSFSVADSKKFRDKESTGNMPKLSIVEYEEVDAEEAALKQTLRPGEIASSENGAEAGPVAALNLAYNVKSGQFGFTTYGYGHGVGLSQNGANAYAEYGGYNYSQILFHYYPGTNLVQTEIPAAVSAGGKTGSVIDIVSMVVYNEMSSTMHTEAMKAQAVAAYTIIMNPNGDSGSLICKSNPPENVRAAVQSVLGQALMYDGEYAMTVFSASSGGYTANSYDVFRTNYPYLISVPCVYDAEHDPHYGSVTYMSTEEVRSRLQSTYGVSLSGDPHSWISLNAGNGGYITSALIGGKKNVTGESLRAALGLKSGRFTFVIG
ncbi:MAG: SpoIID/LytB domain-containing protein [Ruminococcus sp.]